ncbi:transcriptional adapter 2-beta, partial [Aphelenchoides avenae]
MSKEELTEKLNPQRESPLKALPCTVCQGKQKKQQVPTEKKKCRVCVACSEPLQNTTYIRCCECAKSNVVLCHECFSAGAEIGAHKRGHAYEVKDPRSCPVFGSEGEQWGCEMDLEMLAAFKDYQDGSWEPEGIDVTKTNAAEAVHRHIDECFLNGHVGGYVLKDKRWPGLKEVDQSIARQIVEDKRANADAIVAESTELQPQKNVVGNDPDNG